METPEQITNKAEELYRKVETEGDAVAKVTDILDYALELLETDQFDIVKMSRAMLRLQGYRYQLGGFVTTWRAMADSADAYRKNAFARDTKKIMEVHGYSATKAESEAEILSWENRMRAVQYEFVAKKLEILYENADRTISVLQTRMRQEGNEKFAKDIHE